ncbi:MAG: hypothetical protein ABIT83_05195 [Massilia sp.]
MNNKYLPHLCILPEDDADRALAIGFLLDDRVDQRRIDILKPAGGWLKVLDGVADCGLDRYAERRLLLLMDFDDDVHHRLPKALARIPGALRHRVYLLGSASEPERLSVGIGAPLEQIGMRAAQQCAEGRDALWDHPLLRHNRPEWARLTRDVRPFVMR